MHFEWRYVLSTKYQSLRPNVKWIFKIFKLIPNVSLTHRRNNTNGRIELFFIHYKPDLIFTTCPNMFEWVLWIFKWTRRRSESTLRVSDQEFGSNWSQCCKPHFKRWTWRGSTRSRWRTTAHDEGPGATKTRHEVYVFLQLARYTWPVVNGAVTWFTN